MLFAGSRCVACQCFRLVAPFILLAKYHFFDFFYFFIFILFYFLFFFLFFFLNTERGVAI